MSFPNFFTICVILLSPVHPKVEEDIPVLERNLKEVVLPEDGMCILRLRSMVPPRIPKTNGVLESYIQIEININFL